MKSFNGRIVFACNSKVFVYSTRLERIIDLSSFLDSQPSSSSSPSQTLLVSNSSLLACATSNTIVLFSRTFEHIRTIVIDHDIECIDMSSVIVVGGRRTTIISLDGKVIWSEDIKSHAIKIREDGKLFATLPFRVFFTQGSLISYKTMPKVHGELQWMGEYLLYTENGIGRLFAEYNRKIYLCGIIDPSEWVSAVSHSRVGSIHWAPFKSEFHAFILFQVIDDSIVFYGVQPQKDKHQPKIWAMSYLSYMDASLLGQSIRHGSDFIVATGGGLEVMKVDLESIVSMTKPPSVQMASRIAFVRGKSLLSNGAKLFVVGRDSFAVKERDDTSWQVTERSVDTIFANSDVIQLLHGGEVVYSTRDNYSIELKFPSGNDSQKVFQHGNRLFVRSNNVVQIFLVNPESLDLELIQEITQEDLVDFSVLDQLLLLTTPKELLFYRFDCKVKLGEYVFIKKQKGVVNSVCFHNDRIYGLFETIVDELNYFEYFGLKLRIPDYHPWYLFELLMFDKKQECVERLEQLSFLLTGDNKLQSLSEHLSGASLEMVDCKLLKRILDDLILKDFSFLDISAKRFLVSFICGVHQDELHQFALRSDTKQQLMDYLNKDMSFDLFSKLKMNIWLPLDLLKKQLEVLARASYLSTKDPVKCGIFYLLLNKPRVWHGIWKVSSSNDKDLMLKFLDNDFAQDRWKSAAVKNAYALLGKQRYELAVCFFLLGGKFNDAMNVLSKQNDVVLCDVMRRLSGAEVVVEESKVFWVKLNARQVELREVQQQLVLYSELGMERLVNCLTEEVGAIEMKDESTEATKEVEERKDDPDKQHKRLFDDETPPTNKYDSLFDEPQNNKYDSLFDDAPASNRYDSLFSDPPEVAEAASNSLFNDLHEPETIATPTRVTFASKLASFTPLLKLSSNTILSQLIELPSGGEFQVDITEHLIAYSLSTRSLEPLEHFYNNNPKLEFIYLYLLLINDKFAKIIQILKIDINVVEYDYSDVDLTELFRLCFIEYLIKTYKYEYLNDIFKDLYKKVKFRKISAELFADYDKRTIYQFITSRVELSVAEECNKIKIAKEEVKATGIINV